MHPGRLWGAVAAAIAATGLAIGEWPALAFAPVSGQAEMEEFSPLFSRRLEAGVAGMDAPPDRVRIAAMSRYEDTEVVASAQPASVCVGSACIYSYCFGSACVQSHCLGSACSGSGCLGSLCGGSGCLGSACLGSGCLGSACTHCVTSDPEEPEA